MKKILLFATTVFAFVVIVLPASGLAFDPYQNVCDGGETNSSSVCSGKTDPGQNPVSGQSGIINKIANVLAIIGGVIAVVIIMFSGLKIITSSGESQKIADARNAVLYASIGLVVIASARLLIQIVLRNL